MDYGLVMDMLQNLTFCECFWELPLAWRGRRFLRWSVWYLFCFGQVSEYRLCLCRFHLFACMFLLKIIKQTNILISYLLPQCTDSLCLSPLHVWLCLVFPCSSAASLEVWQFIWIFSVLTMTVWGVLSVYYVKYTSH